MPSLCLVRLWWRVVRTGLVRAAWQVGNVWEWVGGGTNEARVLRGGSFIDSLDGSFNHAATVSLWTATATCTRVSNDSDVSASPERVCS